MANSKLKPGSTVDSWCTKCKLVLAHTVETMLDGKITRVHCNTCRGQHAYRATAPGSSKASGGASKSARSKVEKAPKQNDLETLLRGRTAASARPYATTERFAPGEVISHAAFGLGVVTGERDSIKIDVQFADGPKVLMHGR